MTVEQLRQMDKVSVLNFIREKLREDIYPHLFSGGEVVTVRDIGEGKAEMISWHLRFEMSGYEKEKGECTLHNQRILNKFAFLGIYDYTNYLFLDFYKGCGTLWLKYFQGEENYNNEVDLCGFTTSEIIYEIFELTIFSGKKQRRRS